VSSRAQLACVPAERRAHAVAVLSGFVSLRVSSASVLALVDAAADALADGHGGAARDLLAAVCSPERAERILLDMLDDGPAVAAGDDRELVA
jgi:hypothetical protein